MNDPVIDAARRAWESRAASAGLKGIAYRPGESGLWTPEAMEASAREALKRIQELWRREMGANNGATYNERARRIFDGLAPLIFNDDEREGGS